MNYALWHVPSGNFIYLAPLERILQVLAGMAEPDQGYEVARDYIITKDEQPSLPVAIYEDTELVQMVEAYALRSRPDPAA